MKVLEMVGRRRGGLTNKEISQELQIATSSSSYILSRLEREGYLERNAVTGRYEIGLKILAIAHGALRQMDFRTVADPVLQGLTSETKLEAVIGVLEQDRLMVVSRVPSGHFPKADVDTGSEFPAHATAIGKVLLAHLPEEQIQSLVEKKSWPKLTSRTITSIQDLLAELERVRRRGYSVSDEEQRLGLRAVGAPIVDCQGAVRAAVAAVGTTKQPIWRETSAVVELVKAAGHEISRLVRFNRIGSTH